MSSKEKKSNQLKTFLASFAVCFLPFFMGLIFSPAETFFANASELPFVYKEFFWYLFLGALIASLILSLITAILPKKLRNVLLGIIFAISVCFYIQNMFLNKGLDLIGITAEGYVAEAGKSATNLIIWIVIAIICVVASVFVKDAKVAVYGSVFLLLIQLLGFVSLFPSADEACFKYPETEYHLSGENQLTVSSDENIIMFILDSYSDRDLMNALEVDGSILDDFDDFTFYNNMDSVYCGTYPSVTHMLTNGNVEFDKTVNEWTKSAWNSDKCNYFYDSLKEKGFTRNLYTPDLNLLCGSNNTEELISGHYDNFGNSPLTRIVANSKVCQAMIKMSCYKLSPIILKSNFNVGLDEYFDVVAIKEDPIAHENYDFSSILYDRGLTADSSSKYFIVQHLMGTHLYTTDTNGLYREETTPQETAIGCLHIVNEYINELKRLGVYDKSTIIVTADHGMGYGQQPIFFLKEKDTSNGGLIETDAPTSFDELLPTLAKFAGIDPAPIGDTFDKYSDGELRERTLYIMDYYDDYKPVNSYYNNKAGSHNVFVGYTYTGNEDNLLEYIFDKPSKVIQMVESYF